MARTKSLAEDLLDDFINEAERYFQPGSIGSFNRWIEPEDDTLRKVYVRRSTRLAPQSNRIVVCLDIGSVVVDPPGQGRFTDFLRFIEHRKPFDGLFIESVLNPRFADFFRRRMYDEIPNMLPPAFIQLWT